MAKCSHDVYVDGAGPFYNDLVCESCGKRIPFEQRDNAFVRCHLLGRRIRKVKPEETFYSDGVRKENCDV